MMRKLIGAVILMGLLLAMGEAKRRYDNYKVIQVIPTTQSHLELLDALENNIDLGLDFWSRGGLNAPTDVSVPPQAFGALKKELKNAGMTVTVTNQNLQVLLDKEDSDRVFQAVSTPDIHSSFLDYDQAMDWLSNFASTHSSLMKMGVMGVTETVDHRELRQITINNGAGERKPTIWIETLTHAREWAGLSTTLNLIEWLCEGYGLDPYATAILDKYDIEINPIGNPDGYANSFTEDRLWRKNGKIEKRNCKNYNGGNGHGVDLNRNWDNHWGVVGTSTNPCQYNYHGTSASSEAEITSFVAAMELTPVQLRKAFIAIHTYSQMILLPYGWTTDITPSNYDEELRVANAAVEALETVRGTIFQVGRPGDLLYNAAGGSIDYALDSLSFDYTFAYELHPASGGSGFLLDPSEIVNVFVDFKASFIAIADEMQ